MGALKVNTAVALIVSSNGLPSLPYEIGASEEDESGESRTGFIHCCEGWSGDGGVVETAGSESSQGWQRMGTIDDIVSLTACD